MFIKNKYFMFCTPKFMDCTGVYHFMICITIFKLKLTVDVYK